MGEPAPGDAPWHLDRRMQRREIGGAGWSYIDTGGDKPAILLLPGSVGTCEVFFKQIGALAPAYRVVAATYPALSDSAQLADSLAGLHEALGLADALIAGSSFAAYWLQFFALRHPKRIRKLVLANGFTEGGPLRAHPLFDPEVVSSSPAAALQRTWHERVSQGPAGELRRMQLDMLSGRQPADVLQSRLRGVVDAKPCPPLPIPDTHLVLLDCEDDAIVTSPMRAALRARFPGAAHHGLPAGGHYPHILNPAAYDAVLRAHAGRV